MVSFSRAGSKTVKTAKCHQDVHTWGRERVGYSGLTHDAAAADPGTRLTHHAATGLSAVNRLPTGGLEPYILITEI